MIAIREHIEDTIGRLNSIARCIDSESAHNREVRMLNYQEKGISKQEYEAFKIFAEDKTCSLFPNATPAFQQRIAQSYVRLIIWFSYLESRQRKSATASEVQGIQIATRIARNQEASVAFNRDHASEVVAALRKNEFPSLPHLHNGSYQCPCCGLVFPTADEGGEGERSSCM